MKNKSFTLVELLLVIAVIGLILSIVSVSWIEVRKKSRDAKRLSDMRKIITALELYYENNGRYPNSDYQGCEGWDTPGDGDFLQPLVDQGFLPPGIKDPLRDWDCGNYRYYRYQAGSYGCDPSRGTFYVLGIVDMETSNGPHPKSPGWRCPSKDWQNEMEWVTGRFEY